MSKGTFLIASGIVVALIGIGGAAHEIITSRREAKKSKEAADKALEDLAADAAARDLTDTNVN